jgi:hypothetical protein
MRIMFDIVGLITSDNASNNNVMVGGLEDLLPDFGGAASHTQCFLHTVNLIAKSLLREFDVMKKADVRETDDDVASDMSDMVKMRNLEWVYTEKYKVSACSSPRT